MNIKKSATAAIAAVAAFGLTAANAAPYTFDITSAGFSDFFPASATPVVLLDTDGTAGDDTIEYGAAPASIAFKDTTPVSGTVGDIFEVGTFSHGNFVTFGSESIDGATLNIVGDLTIDGTLFSGLTFSYLIEIDNTPNAASACPGEAVPCDDIITITTLDSSDTVFFGGENLSVNIIGFFLDGENVSSFATEEGAFNTAKVLATIDTLPEVPVPGAVWLMGAGVALVASRRKRKSA